MGRCTGEKWCGGTAHKSPSHKGLRGTPAGCVCFELNPQKANVALLTYSPKEGPQVFDEISRNGS
eukprot:scaffold50315_cov19-Tisochrysis_lutea.AAC.1